jgi:hypothetical protein
VCEVEALHKQVLQTKVSVRDAPFMEVSDSTHQLLEEKSRQAFLEGTLILQHVINSSHGCILVYDAQRVIAQENLYSNLQLQRVPPADQTCEMSFSGVENLLSPVWHTQCREGVCVCRIVW